MLYASVLTIHEAFFTCSARLREMNTMYIVIYETYVEGGYERIVETFQEFHHALRIFLYRHEKTARKGITDPYYYCPNKNIKMFEAEDITDLFSHNK